jgi:hypothetical protein
VRGAICGVVGALCRVTRGRRLTKQSCGLCNHPSTSQRHAACCRLKAHVVVFVYNVCTDFPAELASVVASCAQSAGSVPILVALTHIDQVRRQVIGTWAMHLCVPAASAHGCHIRTGTGAHPCHIRTGTGLIPGTAAPGLGLIPATSAPGLGSSLAQLRRWLTAASSSPGLGYPCHIHNGAGRTPICTGTGLGVLCSTFTQALALDWRAFSQR